MTNHTGKPFYTCEAVSPLCPVEATTLGYYPIRGFNIFFAIGFGFAGVATLVLGTWKKTWSYMAFVAAGSMLELAGESRLSVSRRDHTGSGFLEAKPLEEANNLLTVHPPYSPGYAARVPLSDNPWNSSAFQTQICAIILGPTLICISIYLTLKHVCLSLNPSLSRVRPGLYPFIFLPLDVSCLLVQAIGGALAASAGYDNRALLESGNRAIIAGICLQVVVLSFFGTVSADYYLRVRRWIRGPDADPEALAMWHDAKFRRFVYAVTGAYAAILIRCIYR